MGIPLQEVATGTAVRRLTPRETERLQGLPDDWTRYLADGTVQSDSARYRQTGNSVAVPVFEWVTRRIVATDTASSRTDTAA
jgi:DNA (cytosine-5)-methyltransferase 1